MNENEQLILDLIKDNPFISQQEIADIMGLSRPSVANIISGLVKKDYILGKAYVINPIRTIVCIGAANVDKKIKTTEKLKSYTSNPVTSTTSIGGVARNVAENLGRLGQQVSLLTVGGYDSECNLIKELSSPFMNVESFIQIEGQSTGTYTALLDNDGEMYLALADMSVYDSLKPELLAKQSHLLQHASCIVADLNCPKETIEYLCSFAKKNDIKLALITVSEPKMDRMPKDLSAVSVLITNIGETQAYFNEKYQTREEVEQAGLNWLKTGVNQVVLTAGSKDVLVVDKGVHWYSVKSLDANKIKDVTGAGDSFSAAYLDAYLNDESRDKCVLAGMTNAYYTIQSSSTVRHDLTKEKLIKEMKEY